MLTYSTMPASASYNSLMPEGNILFDSDDISRLEELSEESGSWSIVCFGGLKGHFIVVVLCWRIGRGNLYPLRAVLMTD
jgi:hypothetical protein